LADLKSVSGIQIIQPGLSPRDVRQTGALVVAASEDPLNALDAPRQK
jgi:hypothetical protein